MPIRFSTQAANADHMRMEGEPGEDMPEGVGADGTPRERSNRPPQRREPKGGARDEQEANSPKPGKDINAPGFVKDKDAGKP